MNIVTMSRGGAVARLTLVSLIAFGTTLLTLGDARPDHVLAWEDWVKAILAALYVAYNYMSKAWAASSTDAPPLSALVGVSAPLLAPAPAQALAPVSASPGAAQGFSDVAAADDGHDLIGGEETT